MTSVLFFVDQIALGLYGVIGAWMVLQVWRLLAARAEFRAAHFELERDLARTRQSAALTAMVLSVQMMLLVLGVQQSVVPFLESEEDMRLMIDEAEAARLQDGTFLTATPPPVAQNAFDIEPVPPLGGDNDDILLLTPTLTPTPVGTIVPNAPPIEGCDDPRATLQVPANGMRVFQTIRVIGTAYTDEFRSAKIEINGPATENTWSVVNDIFQPLQSTDDMAQFIPTGYEEGRYRFRLMVFDLDNTPVASCMVNIYISPPPVTPTPTPPPGG